jgi:hypothetical protein
LLRRWHEHSVKALPNPMKPSRSVPGRLKAYILIGGALPIAWFLLTIGTFAYVFVALLPAGEPLVGPTYDRRADGVVTRVAKSGEIFNTPVLAVDASFADDHGVGHEVRSYEWTSRPRLVDSHVYVDYQSIDPQLAVIDGMRTHATPWWFSPLLIVVGIGFSALPAIFGFPRRRRGLALLQHGEHVTGTITSIATKGTGEDLEYVATIELPARDGRILTIAARSSKDSYFTVGHPEAVVFDPARPEHATLLRQLPGKPVIEGDRAVRFG